MSEYEALSKKIDEIKSLALLSVKKVYTVEEAALYMGMTADYIRKMVKGKKIKSYRSRSGKGIYFHQSDLDKWMMHTEINTKEFIKAEAARIASRLN